MQKVLLPNCIQNDVTSQRLCLSVGLKKTQTHTTAGFEPPPADDTSHEADALLTKLVYIRVLTLFKNLRYHILFQMASLPSPEEPRADGSRELLSCRCDRRHCNQPVCQTGDTFYFKNFMGVFINGNPSNL